MHEQVYSYHQKNEEEEEDKKKLQPFWKGQWVVNLYIAKVLYLECNTYLLTQFNYSYMYAYIVYHFIGIIY